MYYLLVDIEETSKNPAGDHLCFSWQLVPTNSLEVPMQDIRTHARPALNISRFDSSPCRTILGLNPILVLKCIFFFRLN